MELNKDEIIAILREKQSYLRSRYGLKKIGLFGSYSRGEVHGKSDVDLVVEFERPIGLEFIEFTDELEELLGKKADVLATAGVGNIRNPEVLREIQGSTIYV